LAAMSWPYLSPIFSLIVQGFTYVMSQIQISRIVIVVIGVLGIANLVFFLSMIDPDFRELEHLPRRLNRLWIHMTVRIRFNIHTGTKGPVMNGEALF